MGSTRAGRSTPSTKGCASQRHSTIRPGHGEPVLLRQGLDGRPARPLHRHAAPHPAAQPHGAEHEPRPAQHDPRAVDQEQPSPSRRRGPPPAGGARGRRAGRPQRGSCRRSAGPAPPGCAASPPRRSRPGRWGGPQSPPAPAAAEAKPATPRTATGGTACPGRCAGGPAGTGQRQRGGRRLLEEHPDVFHATPPSRPAASAARPAPPW